MTDSDKQNWSGFIAVLTEKRQQMFRTAITAYNHRSQRVYSDSAHVYEHMSGRGKAFDTREWSIAYVMESFSADEGAKCREVSNISGIELDKLYFLYFRKIEDLNQIPLAPKTIRRIRNESLQPRLLDDSIFEEIQISETPLHDLYPILVAYVRSGGLITTLHFIDQFGDAERNRYQLELTSSSVREQVEVKPIPTSTFRLKGEDKKRDEA